MERETTAQEVTNLVAQYNIGRVELRRKLIEHFNDSDLKDLAFDLAINDEDLPAETHSDKARELIRHCEQRGRLAELLALCARERPGFFPAPAAQAELVQAAKAQAVVSECLAGDAYGTMALDRLTERPESESRRSALEILLKEMLAEDTDFAQKVAAFLEAGAPTGDTINQHVAISDGSQTGDISLIGKVGGDIDLKKLLGK